MPIPHHKDKIKWWHFLGANYAKRRAVGLSRAGLADLANIRCVDKATIPPMSQPQLVPALLPRLP